MFEIGLGFSDYYQISCEIYVRVIWGNTNLNNVIITHQLMRVLFYS
jgi:hypothetical protein